jgi:hypothetical protein
MAETPAWQRKEGQNPKGGLNAKGRRSYARETGGKLKPPVKRGDNPRRASFLARMGNASGPEYDEKGEPTRLLLSLRAWGASSKEDARRKAKAISARNANKKKVKKAEGGLDQWFEEKWVDLSRPKEGGGYEPCGREDAESGKYPKCVPASQASRMTSKEIESAIRRKRSAESKQTRQDKKPINVPTFTKSLPESVEVKIRMRKEMDSCPIATKNIVVNMENRQRCIDEANYGPLNPELPNEDYWQAKADQFKDTVENAKTARCGNCSAFIQTPEMLECMVVGIDPEEEGYSYAIDVIKKANLGYCELYDFKCAGERTCDAWIVGGPINSVLEKAKNIPTDKELYARVKAEAKKKFDVYPSAYANGWLVQEYKRRGGKYKKG